MWHFPLCVQNGEAKLGPPIIMCTRSYPEGSAFGEGADGVCDMDSSAENANSSDSLIPPRKARSRSVTHRRSDVNHLFPKSKEKICLWVNLICFCFLFFFYLFFYFAVKSVFFASDSDLLRVWFLGRSSLRTMEKVRMWILLPAVLALKKSPEQMVSQIWVPLCLQGRSLTNDFFSNAKF